MKAIFEKDEPDWNHQKGLYIPNELVPKAIELIQNPEKYSKKIEKQCNKPKCTQKMQQLEAQIQQYKLKLYKSKVSVAKLLNLNSVLRKKLL